MRLPFFRQYRTLRFGAPIIVVSGLPRSGTSMVMAMLEAGGLDIVTDGRRAADEHNPRGYFECEQVKTLETGGDASWLASARGKAIKVISFLLPHLPAGLNYRVVFMHRDIGEVLTSQHKMLDAAGAPDAAADRRLRTAYEVHLDTVGNMLRHRSCFEVLDLRYDDVLAHPIAQAERLAAFVRTPLDVPRMAAIVHQRPGPGGGKPESSSGGRHGPHSTSGRVEPDAPA